MRPNLEYFELLAEARNSEPIDQAKKWRLAVVADCATQQLVPLMKALCRRRGINVEVYEGPFDAIELEVKNPASSLYAFEPDIVLVLNSVQSLRDRFYLHGDSPRFYEESLNRTTDIWDSIRANSSATILQSTFAAPIERVFGNYEHRVDESLSSIAARLNASIVAESAKRKGILLLDVNFVASWVGLASWFDERLWALAKTPCSLTHLPLIAQSVVDVVLSARGQAIKCIAVDLDNTLWGGVVGDDGPHGIRVGAHGDGEPHFRLQCFLKQLKRRGILLAVCSKNDHENALKPFRENAEMVLRLDDFVAFVANWENKPSNIRSIQQTLNIGLDSILFLDDNPFERAAVRSLLPEVIVPELPEDPAEWVKCLSELNLFEAASFSEEDKKRSELYRREEQRRVSAESAPDFETFLQSLQMQIEVARFVPEHVGRIVQLLQRSNQFNLTTRRHNEAECVAMMRDVDGCLPFYAKLEDRFGDHGLISIVVLRPDHEKEVLAITDWLMSCRVLTRGVEEYVMNVVFDRARRMGLDTVSGIYVPTPKNQMVKDFYGRFGFEKILEEPNGTSHWIQPTSAYIPRRAFIQPGQGCATAAA